MFFQLLFSPRGPGPTQAQGTNGPGHCPVIHRPHPSALTKRRHLPGVGAPQVTGLEDRIARKNVKEAQPRTAGRKSLTSYVTFLLQRPWTRNAWLTLCRQVATVMDPISAFYNNVTQKTEFLSLLLRMEPRLRAVLTADSGRGAPCGLLGSQHCQGGAFQTVPPLSPHRNHHALGSETLGEKRLG